VSADDRSEQPLATGSRAIRIAALANLPCLGAELNAELEAQSANAVRIVVATEVYLTELEASISGAAVKLASERLGKVEA
jgi:hypothetical protein